VIRLVANILAFEIGWSACILGAAHGRAWLGPVVVGAIAAVTLATDTKPRRELIAVACVGAGGVALDSILLATGLLGMPRSPRLAGAPIAFFPVFFAMWVNFALLLNVSLFWLRRRWLLAAVLGAAGAPPTYYLAHRLGAVTLAEPLGLTLAVVAVEYAIAVPAASWLAWRIRENELVTARHTAAGGQTA